MQTEFTSHKPGTFCWIDLATTDTKAAKEFYNDLFGWEIQDIPIGENSVYTFLNIKGKPAAAMGEMQPEQKAQGFPPFWTTYVAVKNAQATINKARELGGMVMVDAMDVMDEGRFGIVADPEGGMIAVWESKNHNGAAWKNIPGSLVYVEHGGHGNEAVVPFYEKLFGWTSQVNDMGSSGPYTTFLLDDETVAGRYIMPPDMAQIPAHWLPYFGTANIDEVLQKARKHGANIPLDKMFIEGLGHYAVIQDPQGGVFGVFQPAM